MANTANNARSSSPRSTPLSADIITLGAKSVNSFYEKSDSRSTKFTVIHRALSDARNPNGLAQVLEELRVSDVSNVNNGLLAPTQPGLGHVRQPRRYDDHTSQYATDQGDLTLARQNIRPPN